MIYLQILLTLLGLLGLSVSVLGFPGIILVYLSIAISGVYSDFQTTSAKALLIAGLITLLSFLVDNFAVLGGAKKFGSSKKGMIGAFVGSFLGFFFLGGPIGLVIGPFIGAIIGEFLSNPTDIQKVFRSGMGAFLGYMVGIVIKFVITAGMFGWGLSVIW